MAAAPGRPLVRLLLVLAFMAAACTTSSEGKIPMATLKQIRRVNRGGARVGVVVPNAFEMNPLLQSRSFVPDERFPFLDFAGVQTPNCIRQTVFDAVALDYQQVTVITDATAAASPEVHIANILDMKNVGVATMTLQEWCGSKA